MDYRKDFGPFDVYMYEPMALTEDAGTRATPNILIKGMVEEAENMNKSKMFGKKSNGQFLFGAQKTGETDWFSRVTQIVDKILKKGPSKGIEWLLETCDKANAKRWK